MGQCGCWPPCSQSPRAVSSDYQIFGRGYQNKSARQSPPPDLWRGYPAFFGRHQFWWTQIRKRSTLLVPRYRPTCRRCWRCPWVPAAGLCRARAGGAASPRQKAATASSTIAIAGRRSSGGGSPQMATTEIWLLTGALFLLGLGIWALYGSWLPVTYPRACQHSGGAPMSTFRLPHLEPRNPPVQRADPDRCRGARPARRGRGRPDAGSPVPDAQQQVQRGFMIGMRRSGSSSPSATLTGILRSMSRASKPALLGRAWWQA